MINGLSINSLTEGDFKSACQVFEIAIPDAFEKEGLGELKDEMEKEVMHKKQLLDTSLNKPNSDIFFLVAKMGDKVIGTISFGPCGEDARKCTDNELQNVGELGSLYVLPEHQDKGIGSALINALIEELSKKGIEEFCLDSGYRRAQKRWIRKFGEPYRVVKDYWGPDSVHMVWFCKLKNFIKE